MRKSRLSVHKQSKLLKHFVAGTTSRCASKPVNINNNTATLYFKRFRVLVAYHVELGASEVFEGEIEVNKSYLGDTQKGKRGRGAARKVPVFQLTKHGRKAFIQLIKDAKSGTLMSIIRHKIVPKSIVYSDCWGPYSSMDRQGFRHFRINHSKFFADKKNHINAIENFWNQAKRHLRKFNSAPKGHFCLFLKECD